MVFAYFKLSSEADAHGMNIGYLIPEFPGQTHIMFWREIEALRQMGERVALVSTKKPAKTCPHAFALEAIRDTYYLYLPSFANLFGWAAGGARGLAPALTYLRGLSDTSAMNRARHYGLLACAIDLTQWARQQRIDHIHGHSCADSAHILALARQLGGPSYSLTLHGDLSVYGPDQRSKMKDASFVHIVGRHLRRQVEDQAGVPSCGIVETFMGVATSAAREPASGRSNKPGVLHLVTVARLHPAKGHAHALRAVLRGVQKGLDLNYTIVGEGPHRAALVALSCELGLKDRVHFAGALSESEVFESLSKADVFLLPSTGLGEAWPVSIMEAMSASLPIVATDIGATSEIITHDRNGFLIPQADEAALLKTLTLLSNDPDLRRRLGEAARTTALERFDVKISASVLRNAVRMAFDRGSRAHRSSALSVSG